MKKLVVSGPSKSVIGNFYEKNNLLPSNIQLRRPNN